MVAYKEGKLTRVQVKYRSVKNGTILFRCSSSWADKNGSHTKLMDKNEVDLVCVYCPETDKCYYVDPSTMKTSLRLRLDPTHNNQTKGISLATQFEKVPS